MLFRTVQTGIVKKVIENLKELLDRVNITCDANGIHITGWDISKTVLVEVDLQASKAEIYKIGPNEVHEFGMVIERLHRTLKSIHNDETLTLSLESHRDTVVPLIITSMGNMLGAGEYEVSTSEVDDKINENQRKQVFTDGLHFSYMVQLKSHQLQQILKGMNDHGVRNITIAVEPSKMEIYGAAELSQGRRTLTMQENGLTIVKQTNDADDRIEVSFSLKILFNVAKTAIPSEMVTLYLMTEYPMMVHYDNGLASSRLLMMPLVDGSIQHDEMQNYAHMEVSCGNDW